MVVMYAGECGGGRRARRVLDAPLHPYTMGLYNAFPDLHGAGAAC